MSASTWPLIREVMFKNEQELTFGWSLSIWDQVALELFPRCCDNALVVRFGGTVRNLC